MHVFLPHSWACVQVCVCLLIVCLYFSTCACVRLCVCRTPLWWFSRCRVAAWCTRRSKLPASCAARGSSWSQPSLWSCSSTKMLMCSTRTRLSCICHPGATRTQVCLDHIYYILERFYFNFSVISAWIALAEEPWRFGALVPGCSLFLYNFRLCLPQHMNQIWVGN